MNIPQNLKLFVAPTEKVKLHWDDDSSIVLKEISVNATFVSDADNTKTCETGKSWLDSKCSRYDWQTKKTTQLKGLIVLKDNKPTKNVVIASLEHRGQGGRAYKVIVDSKHYVDLREDVLLDLIFHEGIQAGGRLNGSYLWAKVGSQIKLIRENSYLHKTCLKLGDMSKTKKIAASDLKIGHLYESSTRQAIYLGKFKTTEFHLNSPVSIVASDVKSYNVHVFYIVTDANKITFDQPFNFICSKDFTYKLDSGFKVSPPDHWLESYKNHYLGYFLQAFEKGYEYYWRNHNQYIKEYTKVLNIKEIHPNLQKYLCPKS